MELRKKLLVQFEKALLIYGEHRANKWKRGLVPSHRIAGVQREHLRMFKMALGSTFRWLNFTVNT